MAADLGDLIQEHKETLDQTFSEVSSENTSRVRDEAFITGRGKQPSMVQHIDRVSNSIRGGQMEQAKAEMEEFRLFTEGQKNKLAAMEASKAKGDGNGVTYGVNTPDGWLPETHERAKAVTYLRGKGAAVSELLLQNMRADTKAMERAYARVAKAFPELETKAPEPAVEAPKSSQPKMSKAEIDALNDEMDAQEAKEKDAATRDRKRDEVERLPDELISKAASRSPHKGIPPVSKRPFTRVFLRAFGQVDPNGPAGRELKSMGITSKNSPGIFKKGGKTDLNNWPLEEAGDYQFLLQDDGGGYAEQNEIISILVQEAAGEAYLSDEDAQNRKARAEIDEVRNMLEQAGYPAEVKSKKKKKKDTNQLELKLDGVDDAVQTVDLGSNERDVSSRSVVQERTESTEERSEEGNRETGGAQATSADDGANESSEPIAVSDEPTADLKPEILTGDNGKPVTFYHATKAEFDEFAPGMTFWSSNKNIAFLFGKGKQGDGTLRIVEAQIQAVNPVYVDAGDVAELDVYQNQKAVERDKLFADGHDVVIYFNDRQALAITLKNDQVLQQKPVVQEQTQETKAPEMTYWSGIGLYLSIFDGMKAGELKVEEVSENTGMFKFGYITQSGERLAGTFEYNDYELFLDQLVVTSENGANNIGLTQMRNIGMKLLKEFPKAEGISGIRQSGARINDGNDQPVSLVFDLKDGRLVLRKEKQPTEVTPVEEVKPITTNEVIVDIQGNQYNKEPISQEEFDSVIQKIKNSVSKKYADIFSKLVKSINVLYNDEVASGAFDSSTGELYIDHGLLQDFIYGENAQANHVIYHEISHGIDKLENNHKKSESFEFSNPEGEIQKEIQKHIDDETEIGKMLSSYAAKQEDKKSRNSEIFAELSSIFIVLPEYIKEMMPNVHKFLEKAHNLENGPTEFRKDTAESSAPKEVTLNDVVPNTSDKFQAAYKLREAGSKLLQEKSPIKMIRDAIKARSKGGVIDKVWDALMDDAMNIRVQLNNRLTNNPNAVNRLQALAKGRSPRTETRF